MGLNYSFTCLLLLVVTVVTVAVTGSDNSLSVLVQEQISRAVCCTALHPALHYFGKEIQRNLTWNATALRIKTQYIDQKDHNYLVFFARFPKNLAFLCVITSFSQVLHLTCKSSNLFQVICDIFLQI